MIRLGGLHLVGSTLLVLVASLFAAPLDLKDGMSPQEAEALLVDLGIVMLLASPLLMAFWFAPLLTAWNGVSAGKSLFFSFVASWRNWRAFAVYGLTLAVVGAVLPGLILIIAGLISQALLDILSIALRMVLIFVLAPVLMASVYLSYRDVFATPEPVAPAEPVESAAGPDPMSEAGAGVLGLLGGTFDPLHVGHLRLALEAREALGLSEAVPDPGRVPATARPAALRRHAAPGHGRVRAGRLPGFSVDPGEVLADGTERGPELHRGDAGTPAPQHGAHGAPLVLLLGADAFARLESWHRWRELFDLAHIAVATRPGHDIKVGAGDTALAAEFRGAAQVSPPILPRAPAGRIVPFAITALEISATAIRERLARGLSVRYLVPDPVLDYIESRQLYRTPHGH
jgi:nicotinate-nucleotide adenylyltransferase